MSALKPLLDAALVGTQRQAPPQLALAQPLAELMQQLRAATAQPSRQLLQMAGVLAQCEQAGFVPARMQPNLWPPCALADVQPEPDESFAADVLQPIFTEAPDRLQHEALSTLARAGHRVPARLLPAALEVGRRSLALRAALVPVLGERGLWLARLNEPWKFAAGASSQVSVDEQWSHGTQEQRRQLLHELRAQDPGSARTRLEAEIEQMAAKERAELIPLLATGLSPDDEPFLDGLLKDRSKDVRQAAAALLGLLPESRHARFICAQLDALVGVEAKLLRTRVTIDAPAQANPQWKNEAVDPARPTHESLGERAWWLYQLVRQAPLGWWVERCGMQPDALLKWAGGTEWKEALLRGWRDAVLASRDTAWCEAFLAAWDGKMGLAASDFLALLPHERREAYWAQDLTRGGNKALAEVLGRILAECPLGQTLSASLSHQLARLVAAQLAADSAVNDYRLREGLPDALCLLHPSALSVLHPLPGTPTTPAQNEFYRRLDTIVRCRQGLAAFSSTSNGTPS